VAEGWKTVESRTHQRFSGLQGRMIGIHAAKKWDMHWLTLARPWLFDWQVHYTMGHMEAWKELGGHVIATAHISQFMDQLLAVHANLALIDCAIISRSGLFLETIRKVNPPVKWPGGRGIFNVPDDLILKGGRDG
jgi:hypothetical protein